MSNISFRKNTLNISRRLRTSCFPFLRLYIQFYLNICISYLYKTTIDSHLLSLLCLTKQRHQYYIYLPSVYHLYRKHVRVGDRLLLNILTTGLSCCLHERWIKFLCLSKWCIIAWFRVLMLLSFSVYLSGVSMRGLEC